MSNVYRNSYLTITASNAAIDLDRFLKSRDFSYASVKVASRFGEIDFVPGQYQHPAPFVEYLDSRVWTSQESHLSRRQLKFTTGEMVWACQTCEWYESWRDNYDEDSQQGTKFSVIKLLPDRMVN